MTLLTISNLSLRFDNVEAVKDVSVNIGKGEMLAVVGESGSGKSLTALSCIGLQPPSADISGSIRFDGEEIVGKGETFLRTIRGGRIGMVFQEPMTALNPLHTIGKQIGEMLAIHCHSRVGGNLSNNVRGRREGDPRLRGDDKERVLELLDQVGLSHFRDRLDAYPHQMSGGERQRVMIAMAIANKPQLLIADEPTTAVDVTIQVKILKLIKELQKEMNMAVLFITHDLTVVKRLADRVAIMKAGEIVEQGKVSEIFAAPKHPYTQKLLASEPKGSPLPFKTDAKNLIECENLKVYFPIKKGFFRRTKGYVKAVDEVSISLPEGATLGIVGESGSGKTTLGFALLRLIKSDGKIVFMGKETDRLNAAKVRPLREKMQVVFQDPYSSLNPRMNIAQIIGEGLTVHFPGISPLAYETAVDDILGEVGLAPDMKHRYPHEFSGGQRQRISIARAMVLKPKFVVLDEPTSALDLTVQTQIIELLKKLQQKHGLGYMFISHDLRVVKAISHRIAVMRQGKIVEHGDTPALLSSPKSDYTKALIDAAMIA